MNGGQVYLCLGSTTLWQEAQRSEVVALGAVHAQQQVIVIICRQAP